MDVRGLMEIVFDEKLLNVVPKFTCMSEGIITFTHDYIIDNGYKLEICIITDDYWHVDMTISELLKLNLQYASVSKYRVDAVRLFQENYTPLKEGNLN